MRRRTWIGIVCVAGIIVSTTPVIHSLEAATEIVYTQLKVFTELFSIIEQQYVESVDVTKLMYGAAKGMVQTLDPFSQFLPPDEYKELQVQTEGAFGGLGIRISIKETALVVITPLPGTPAHRAGVMPGDKIIKIDGTSTQGFTTEDAVKRLRGTPGTSVTITIVREGEQPRDITMKRENIKIQSVRSRMLPDEIWYLHILEFNAETDKDVDAAYKAVASRHIKAIVLDVRNNPGGLLNSAVDISKKFLGENKLIVYTQGRDATRKTSYHADAVAHYPNVPLVVLVNKWTTSAAEIVSGAIKDWKRGVLVGTQTFGKGSVQTVLPLSDGSGVRLTTAKYYTPNGICIHEKGIAPDVLIEISKEQLVTIMEAQAKDDITQKLDLKPKHDTAEKVETKKEAGETDVDDPQLKYAVGLLKAREIFRATDTNK